MLLLDRSIGGLRPHWLTALLGLQPHLLTGSIVGTAAARAGRELRVRQAQRVAAPRLLREAASGSNSPYQQWIGTLCSRVLREAASGPNSPFQVDWNALPGLTRSGQWPQFSLPAGGWNAMFPALRDCGQWPNSPYQQSVFQLGSSC